jgi:DNA-binding transcriptional ArsR family regulator
VAREVISTSEAPGGFAGYSQAIRANGVVFVSGQGPFDPATGDLVGETIEEQTRHLLEAGELCVCDLAAVTGLSQTACSHNLRLLRSSRLVRYRKQGRNVYYSLDDAHIRLLLDVGLQHVSHDLGDA